MLGGSGGPGLGHAGCLELLREGVFGTWDKVAPETVHSRSVTDVPFCYQIMRALGGGGREDSGGHLHRTTSAGYSAKW